MAKTNSKTEEPEGTTALPNFFADILRFEAHPFRYCPETEFTGVVMRVFFSHDAATNPAYLAADIISYW